MKEINTTRFGTLKVDDAEIIVFPEGILGFEQENEFLFLHDGEDNPFAFLQSVKEPDLTFVVINPGMVSPSYEVEIPDKVVSNLEAKAEDILLLAIVTIPGDLKKATANLQGPLVINKANRKAFQVVLPGEKYGIRYPIFGERKPAKSA